MLKGIWEALSPNIRNIINDAGFGTFFEALLNQETHISTRTFNYSLPCQSAFGTPRVLSIFRVLVR